MEQTVYSTGSKKSFVFLICGIIAGAGLVVFMILSILISTNKAQYEAAEKRYEIRSIMHDASSDYDQMMQIGSTLRACKTMRIIVLIVSVTVAGLIFLCIGNSELKITDQRLCGKSAWGKRIDIPIDSIKSTEKTSFDGIAIVCSSGRLVFPCLENRESAYEEASKLITRKEETNYSVQTSNADEIQKWKSLLDQGAISQDEYDAKKRELLK